MMEITTATVSQAPLAPDQLASLTSLAQALAEVNDPRKPSGRRYSLVSLLLLLAAGLLSKATSLRSIARWGRLHAEAVARPLGFTQGHMPCCATLHRVLVRLDAQELDQCLTTWLRNTTPLASGEGIGVDGKTVRGVPGGLHLLAAYAHEAQVVLAQEAVDSKENEIVAAPRVLQTLQLKDRVLRVKDGGCHVGPTVLIQASTCRWWRLFLGGQGQPTHPQKGHRLVVRRAPFWGGI